MKIQRMLLQLDEQHKILGDSMKKNREVKRNITLYKHLKSFKEMNEAYYVGVAISQDPIEIEKMFGFRINPKKTQNGSFLLVCLILPKILQTAMVELGFHINVSVQISKKRLCRTLPVDGSSPIKVVLPWTEFPINSELDISFFGKVETINIVFRTRKIVLNMPLFLKSVKHMEQNRKYRNYKDDLMEISRQYIIHKKCLYNEYNSKYAIIVPKNFKLVDVLRRSFPHHLIGMSDSMIEEGIFHILRDTSMVSQVAIVKENRWVEIHSDIYNLWKMKQYYIDENYNNGPLEVLAIKQFLGTTYPNLNRGNPLEVYYCLRDLWKINFES